MLQDKDRNEGLEKYATRMLYLMADNEVDENQKVSLLTEEHGTFGKLV